MNGCISSSSLNYKVDHGNQQQRFPYKRKPDDSFAAGMFPTVRYEMEEKPSDIKANTSQ